MTSLKAKPARIDWQRVRERLRGDEEALAQTLAENPARIAEVYRQRAVQLAVSKDAAASRVKSTSAILFKLQQETYAIALADLLEILPLGAITAVPGARADLLGVMNLRGELRAVVDLRRLLQGVSSEPQAPEPSQLPDEPAALEPASGSILLLRRPGREIGLYANSVEGMRMIPLAEEDTGNGKFTKRIPGETVLLLDVEKVLAEIFPPRSH